MYPETLLVAQLCPVRCDLMDCSTPGFSVHEILQARILKWVAIPFSRGSFWPRDWAWVSCIADRFFTKSPKQDSDTGKDQRQKEKRAVEYELVRQHHCINGCELEQTLGDTEGQGSWHSAVLGVAKSLTWFSDGTTTKKHCMDICYGLNCVLPKFICWSLNPQTSKGTLFGSRAV